MTTAARLLLLAVLIVMPFGVMLLGAYLAWRARRGPDRTGLDFAEGLRRVPALRSPPPVPGLLGRRPRPPQLA